MAADGVFVAAEALSRLDDPAAGELALELLESFARSDGARYRFFRVAPTDLGPILERIAASRRLPLPSGFPSSLQVVGALPFARPAGGYIGEDSAAAAEMTFLDASGRPGSAGGGSYAWDRPTGRILHVVASDRDEILIVP
jgi:hypothetical protein